MSYITDRQAAELIRQASPRVIEEINSFTRSTFKTRGGRLGSGMGLLFEGLWGYHTSRALEEFGIEISWIAEDQYNDYAVTRSDEVWDPVTREGELLRIEAKTMNLGAEETKGHFAELTENITDSDLLLILLWRWTVLPEDSRYVVPQIVDVLLERAKPIAQLRDELHIARGGAFVDPNSCPDDCIPRNCSHAGEPLNARGKRERISGPESTRPSMRVAFAANFGGLKRMLGGRSQVARQIREEFAKREPAARRYIDFMQQDRIANNA